MRGSGRQESQGFTLIELMIAVAIIGILAAIAIPNFLRYQLRIKAGESKVNLSAIRTAEESYFAEYGTYVSCADSPAAWTVGVPAAFKLPWADAGGFSEIGWSPDGEVYFQYHVEDPGGTGTEFVAEARSDLDSDTVQNVWGYVKPQAGLAAASANGSWGCPAGGLFIVSATGIEVVGPCCPLCAATIF
jgi:type IV pilus assembly protein PilA